jgi:hypothetical protein
MAPTTVQINNQLIQFRREIAREYIRENRFSPYMGDDINSIIRNIYDPKKGGDQVNIPLVTRLKAQAYSTGTLTGNEEAIDNMGLRMWIDWARNAVKSSKADTQKDDSNIFGEAKSLLTDWGKELQMYEILEAMMALPDNAQPVSLGTTYGNRVNGLRYGLASTTAANKNTWRTNNLDRILYGNVIANSATDHATSLATIDNTADKLSASSLMLMKRMAKKADPRIRPYKISDGREFFVGFTGSLAFRDLAISLEAVNRDARPRETMGPNGAPNNPLFQDGDLLYNGVIVREVELISTMAAASAQGAVGSPYGWGLIAAGGGGIPVEPFFFCGQQALAWPWGQMPAPTKLDQTDYGFNEGVGIEMAYGIGKMAKAPQATPTLLKQWGMLTGFFAAVGDP